MKSLWSVWFIRRAKPALALWLVLATACAWQVSKLHLNPQLRTLLEGDQRNLASYEKVREVLSGMDMLVLSVDCGEVFTPRGIGIVREISEAFLACPGVADVKSLTHSFKPVRKGFSFEMVPFVPGNTTNAAALKSFRTYCLTHPLVKNILVSEDGHSTLITITWNQPLQTVAEQRAWRALIEETLAPFRAQGLGILTIALPLVELELREAISRDVGIFVPAAGLLMFAVLWCTFGSLRIVSLVLVTHAAVLVSLAGLMWATSASLTVFSILLIPLLAGVHLALSAHMFTRYEDFAREGLTPAEACEKTVREIHGPSLMATVTTQAGLLSLLTSSVAPVREFGWVGALGLGLVFVVTFGPGVSLLVFAEDVRRARARKRSGATQGPVVQSEAQKPQEPHAEPALESHQSLGSEEPTSGTGSGRARHWTEPFLRIAKTRPKAVYAGAIAAIALGITGLFFVRTDIRAVEFLKPGSKTRQIMETMDRSFGGVNVVQIDFDSGEADGVNRMGFLQYLDGVQKFAEKRGTFSGVYSYASLMAMINQVWENERPGSLRLPDSEFVVRLFVMGLRAQHFPFLTTLASEDARTAHLVLRTRDMPAGKYLAEVQSVLTWAESHRPTGVQVSARKGLHSILEADRQVLRSQISSAGSTVISLIVILGLYWRSALLGTLVVVVNLIPVAFVIGAAALSGIPLNSINTMVAAIALGISVDDSIHFITHWREEVRRGATSKQAIQTTLRIKGWPIVWTSIILITVCVVFSFSSFPPVSQFGLLSALSFIVALPAVLLLLPTLVLSLFQPRRPREAVAGLGTKKGSTPP